MTHNECKIALFTVSTFAFSTWLDYFLPHLTDLAKLAMVLGGGQYFMADLQPTRLIISVFQILQNV